MPPSTLSRPTCVLRFTSPVFVSSLIFRFFFRRRFFRASTLWKFHVAPRRNYPRLLNGALPSPSFAFVLFSPFFVTCPSRYVYLLLGELWRSPTPRFPKGPSFPTATGAIARSSGFAPFFCCTTDSYVVPPPAIFFWGRFLNFFSEPFLSFSPLSLWFWIYMFSIQTLTWSFGVPLDLLDWW